MRCERTRKCGDSQEMRGMGKGKRRNPSGENSRKGKTKDKTLQRTDWNDRPSTNHLVCQFSPFRSAYAFLATLITSFVRLSVRSLAHRPHSSWRVGICASLDLRCPGYNYVCVEKGGGVLYAPAHPSAMIL